MITGRAGGRALRTDSGDKTCDPQNHIQIVNVSWRSVPVRVGDLQARSVVKHLTGPLTLMGFFDL